MLLFVPSHPLPSRALAGQATERQTKCIELPGCRFLLRLVDTDALARITVCVFAVCPPPPPALPQGPRWSVH